MKRQPLTTYQKVMRTIGISIAILCVLLIISFSPRVKSYINNISENAEMLLTPAVDPKLSLADQSESSHTYKINKGKPEFTEQELSLKSGGSWQIYSNLDQLNRPVEVNAMINKTSLKNKKVDTPPTIQPTGFHQIPYNKAKTGYLYERGQLLNTRLGGVLDSKNIYTATSQLNSKLLARKANQIATYLEGHPNNHVRYRITTIYKDSELVARGVHLEAQSIEDNGLSFNVYVLNLQPGFVINYPNGQARRIL
ncbi:hypothetical protein EQ500_03210 [Lactobacillus sp. XV13L]|nr:hypothetical protein [Lactobacillus sp. XV13L]